MHQKTLITIPLKILIVDPVYDSFERLNGALIDLKKNFSTEINPKRAETIPDAYTELMYKPNIVFIDIVNSGVKKSVAFIRDVRKRYPAIVFIRYCTRKEYSSHQKQIPILWRKRLFEYLSLDKE